MRRTRGPSSCIPAQPVTHPTRPQKSLGFDIDVDCEAVALALTPANYDRTVFGLDRQTVTVGLTEGLYAVTNGRDIQVK